jgi:hypothetical protein
MNDIEQTQWVIHNFEADLATNKAKKQKLFNVGDGKNDNRIQKLDKAIKSTKSVIKISRAQLKHQMDEMGRTMKGLENSSDEEDSK